MAQSIDTPRPATLAHPAANRTVALDQRPVQYLLRRSARRSIGFRIDANGLVVSAPQRASVSAIDAALKTKAHWILQKLAQADELRARRAAAQIEWGDGATLPYLGAPLAIELRPAAPGSRATAALGDGAASGSRTLVVTVPRGASTEQIRDATQAWLLGRARRLFTARLDHFAPQLGVRWRRLTLSAARTRWGSASADGSIRLNWRLVHFPEPVIDYVVVHELAHLHEMNHGARFWAHVQRILPDYAARRQTLHAAALPPW